jgi:uncharacterized coiled-coil protein SlyX
VAITIPQNTAVGDQALINNMGGGANTATGFQSLFSNTTGGSNTANGVQALFSNTTAAFNTANGYFALRSNTTGGSNTAIGAVALQRNTTGGGNTAIGPNTLDNNTTGNNNVAVGILSGRNVFTASNVICIGANVAGANVNDSCFIGNIFGQAASGGSAVSINANGKLGTTTSSRRFKEDIKPMDHASDALFALKPVTFRYKKEIDPEGIPQFGLIAEEVAQVNPRLIVRDKDGKVNTVRYEQINAMLLNEFLKAHRTVQELKSTATTQEAVITELKSALVRQQKDFRETAAQQQGQIDALTTGLQKVSAQIEASKFAAGRIRGGGPAPQVVNNNK